MKLMKRKVCAAFLSIGVLAGSFVVPQVYAAGSNDFVPKVAAIDSYDNPSFVIGELSEKSGDSPEKIVEENYGRKLNGSGDLNQKSFKQNRKFVNSMGRTVVSTVQTFNGVPVYGTDQNYHINDKGVLECIAGSNVEDIENKVVSKSFSAKYSNKEVLDEVENHLGFKPDYIKTPQPEIILYPLSGKYHYVYEVEVKSFTPYHTSCTYYIDAGNLSIIKVDNNVRSAEQPVTGTGIGQFNTIKPLNMVKNDDNTYSLKNTIEQFGTYNADRSFKGIAYLNLITGNDNSFDSGSNYEKYAVDAHSNVTKAARFFNAAPFYRNSNDDKGSYFYVGSITSDFSPSTNAYGDINYVAFTTIPGSSGKTTSCCMDIVVHEYVHGILNSEGMKYVEKEEMAIHEGLGDVFGIIGENFIVNDGSTDDWLIGEDLGQYIRDCANPNINDYNDYISYVSDPNYDPHKAGGVITKAANLLTVGGTHNGVSVNGIGYGKLARIFYNVINDGYLTSNMTFKQFANYAVQSANLLYGPNSQAYKSTTDAFIAVGLLNPAPARFRLMYVSDMNVQLSWEAPSGSRIGVYRRGAGIKDEPVRIATTTSTTGHLASTVAGSCDFYIAYLDAAGNRISAYSNAVNIEKLTKSAPTNFRITYRGGLSVQFSWSGTTGSKYAIYRKISGSNDEFLKVGETTSTTMSVGTLLGKCDFKVAVISADGIRLSPYSNEYSIESFTTAPANFRLTSSTSTTAKFSWEEASGSRYAVYRLIPGVSDIPEKVSETKGTSLTVNLTPGTYDYQVAMVDLEGNRISGFSNIVPVSR